MPIKTTEALLADVLLLRFCLSHLPVPYCRLLFRGCSFILYFQDTLSRPQLIRTQPKYLSLSLLQSGVRLNLHLSGTVCQAELKGNAFLGEGLNS
jgi:hypothetical protein